MLHWSSVLKGECALAFVRHVLRGYSYVFEGILSLMAIGVGLLGAFSQNASMHVGWLPFDGPHVVRWLLVSGVVGLLCLVLAMLGRLRILLFLFALVSTLILVKGLFFGSYTFSGPADAKHAGYLIAGTFVALIGTIPQMVRRAARR